MKIKSTITAFLLFCSVFAFGQDPLFVQVEKDYSTPGELTAQLNMSGFDDIVAMQFTIAYPASALSLSEITVNDSLISGDFTTFDDDPNAGHIVLIWLNQNALGSTLPDGESIFTLKFNIDAGIEHDVYLTDCPLDIEVVRNIEEIIPLTGDVRYECGGATGLVTMDFDENCLENNGAGLAGWTIIFHGENDYSTKSYAGGFYRIKVPEGGYDVELIPPNDLWVPCTPISDVIITGGSSLNLNLVAVPDVICHDTYVNISSPFLRRCFSSTYHVTFGNAGTQEAEDAQIEVILDEDLTYISSEIAPVTQQDSLLIFAVGDLLPGAEMTFRIEVQVGCDDVILGQTHCTSASITPDTICDSSGAWSSAHLTGRAICDGDSVILTLKNESEIGMTTPMDIYVIEDDVIIFLSEFQLPGNEVFSKKYPANGSTWRIHGGQEVNHPQSEKVFAVVEGCVAEEDGQFSIGYVTQFITDPQENGVSISCLQNVGSFDPNDKLAAHQGVGQSHYIDPGTSLDYTIRFQNTGTDTAFNVRLIDTISPLLDVSRLNVVSASHDFEMEIRDGNVLDIYFNDILLVDSFTNEPASNGFIRYRISQSENAPLGSLIENTAAIYFDFNEPIITNTVFHTVDVDYMDVSTGLFAPKPKTNPLNIYPNPADSRLFIESPNGELDYSIKIFDINGSLQFSGEKKGTLIDVNIQLLNPGIYQLEMIDDIGRRYVQKFVVIR